MKLRYSHRIRAWLLNREAAALLRRVNRPHVQSEYLTGRRHPDSDLSITGVAMALCGLVLMLVINFIDKA